MKYYKLINKKPVLCEDVLEWGRWFEDADRDVAKNYIGESSEHTVSTVFLGIDHSFGGGKPLLFETMIFWEDANDYEEYQERYSTWEEAEAGHKRAIDYVLDNLNK
ncbi:MAG: hypothetical protein CMI54_00375 [Parcubacteria group bacterium]|nr:hypothetical protein [Parcubacteria group bacterium]|tara:strand:- start:4955 stop:5272 length:318 start_codon:yes stop_codon:yes gene_type:complete